VRSAPRSTLPDRVAELARALICERLIADGHKSGTDPIWLARLLVSRAVMRSLLARLLVG
jgi:hypothetical protein